ncbi:hypothetical protein VMCG_04584 [Cytospora schulzeri]|uniref:Uncharacterized protein n=1 Tax=Cytospora schulzeri TaxID=448051 RepID=A0A423WRR7_9PEZI|nr:hypothetical protein VMCG_04584 [Valsa malicola]
MSTVLDVIFRTDSGDRVRAALKLYDRRFGESLRLGVDMRKDGESFQHCPHSAAVEARFESFVREGKIGPFLKELEHQKRTELLPPRPSHSYDDTPDGPAKYEASLYQQCQEYFECETEAYARLHVGDFQGKSIPQMYAHNKFIAERLAYLNSETHSSEDDNPEGSGDDEDCDVDGDYLECVRSYDNTGAIGCVMASRMERLKGVKLAIKYPDWDKIIEDVRRTQENMEEAG